MTAPKTGRRAMRTSDFDQDSRGSLGGFYFSCDNTKACAVFVSGLGFLAGEACSWDTGSGIIDIIGAGEFTITDIEGVKPAINTDITGSLSNNVVSDGAYASWNCLSDSLFHTSCIGPIENPFVLSDTAFNCDNGLALLSKNYSAPKTDNVFFGVLTDFDTVSQAQNIMSTLGPAAASVRIQLTGRNTIVKQAGTGATDVTLAVPDIAVVGGDEFAAIACYIDRDGDNIHFLRYAPSEETPWATASTPIVNLDAIWESSTSTLQHIAKSKGIVFLTGVKGNLTEDEMRLLMTEWYDESVATTEANEREKMIADKTALYRLLPD